MIFYILVFSFSLLIGSFLNVLIYRLPRNESVIWPASHCLQCGRRLGFADLVPLLSYVCLKGKCRYCQGKIALHYPLVEALTAFSFLLAYNKWGLSLASLEACLFTAVLLVAAFTDINNGLIPDQLIYPAILAGVVLSCFSIGLTASLSGLGMFGGFFLLMAVLSRGGMGGGDVKLAAAIGAFLGVEGAFMVLVISSWLAVIWAIPVLIKGKAGRKTAVKFGPFMSLAAWAVLMYGPVLLRLYWDLLY